MRLVRVDPRKRARLSVAPSFARWCGHAYLGEVTGVAFFEGLADVAPNGVGIRTLELFAGIERRVARALRPWCPLVSMAQVAEAERAGAAAATAVAHLSWPQIVPALVTAAERGLGEARGVRNASAGGLGAEVVDLYIEHELLLLGVVRAPAGADPESMLLAAIAAIDARCGRLAPIPPPPSGPVTQERGELPDQGGPT